MSKTNDIITAPDTLGWHKDNEGRRCYNAGDRVITAENIEYSPNPELAKAYLFDIYGDDSEFAAIKDVFDIMSIDIKCAVILFCAGILGILRQLVIAAGIKPPCAVYLVGPSGYRKTTLAKLCAKMYNRSELVNDFSVDITQLSSSVPAIEAMMETCKDCAFILDDLNKTTDTIVKRQKERTLRAILRNHADNAPRRTIHSGYAINSQLIITAEYIIDNISDIGRCFLVHVENPISTGRLTEAQQKPLALSTFYYFFIKYICTHYDETVDFIKTEFVKFRNESHAHQYHFERVYEMAFLLECMFRIVCRYAIEKEALSEEVYREMLEKFQEILDDAIKFHSEIVEIKKADSSEFNLSRALIYLIKNKKITMGSKGDDCFMKKGDLYIRSHTIIQALKDEYFLTMSAKKIAAYFSDLGISKGYSSTKNSKNVKKYNNISYLVLRYDLVKQEAFRESNPLEKIL